MDITKEHLDIATKAVYEKGLNVYALLGRYKKISRLREEIPAAVIVGVCKQYLVYEGRIMSQWPWFLRVLEAESHKYFANQNVTENDRLKTAPWKIKISLG